MLNQDGTVRACRRKPLVGQAVPLIHTATPFLASTPFQDLQEPLRIAYTALGGVPAAPSADAGPCPLAEEVHHGGNAALSCRPCLIACNSRQIDEQESGDG
jgi:hypothetical protein